MPKYQNLSDNELVAFLREGDAVAFKHLYDRYFKLMFVFVYKRLRDEDLVKDVVQELFTKLWERRDKLGEISNFSSYLFAIVRNGMLDYFKHKQVGERYIEFLATYSYNVDAQASDFRIREKQLSDYIEKQVQALPKKMRRMFEMSRKDFLSHKQIALQLGTSENNVKTQIMNAIRILKRKVGR